MLQKAIIILLLLAAAYCSLFARENDFFNYQSLTLSGELISLLAADLDGTGSDEIVAVLHDENAGRRLRLFRESPSRQYENLPQVDIPIPSAIVAVQAIDFDKDGRTELLFLASDSLYQLKFDLATKSPILKTVMSLDLPAYLSLSANLLQIDFVSDLNEDGVWELLIPCFDGVRLVENKGGRYQITRVFSCRPQAVANPGESRIVDAGSSIIQVRLPKICTHDLNTDRVKDIFIEGSNGLEIYYQTGNLQFAERPNKRVEIRPELKENLYFYTSAVGDLNNDRLVDYCRVFTHVEQGAGKTVIEVFLANIQDGYSARPSRRIILDELATAGELVDLRGNGALSLIVATIQVSSTSLVKSLLVSRMPIELAIFGASGALVEGKPLAVKRLSCGIDFLQGHSPAKYMGCFTADLDRDRKNELVAVNDDNELEVYKGTDGTIFSDKPIFTMAVGKVEGIMSHDLDGDTRDELLVLGHDEEEQENLTIYRVK